MPTYSYVCDACGGSFELEQRISEKPIDKCQLCSEPKARRQIVSANFILKGGGWYSDGYGSSSSSKPKTSGDGGSPSTPSSAPAKTDAKSDSSSSSGSTSTSSSPTKSESKATAAE